MTSLSESVSLELSSPDGGPTVALIVIDNPPVNALSHHVRQGLVDGFNQAKDLGAEAIVLICDGRTFIAGADISEFGQPPKGPSLAEVQASMENCEIPLIAAIHGTALGGGLEVALCAHYRIAADSAKFGLPEVKLGLLPGAGGTQRLPRLVGVEMALSMVTSGKHIAADEALVAGLIDEVVAGNLDDLRAAGLAFASRAVSANMPLLKVRDNDDKVAEARGKPEIFEQFRQSIARKSRGFLAPEYNIQCIEAAVNLEFDAGIKKEGELFMKLLTGEQSTAQQYYFFSERAANKVPGLAKDTEKLEIAKCGILGAGTMGGGIAMNFANAGIAVTIVERDQEPLDRGLATIKKNYDRSVSRGSISATVANDRMALITGSVDKADFGDCDLIIEAVFEDMDLKKTIFRELDEIAKPGAILASNTSALDLNEIAAVTARPESVIGMHFFSPANVMRLLEVVRGEKSSDTTVATAMAVAKKIGKVGVLVGVCHGFVGNRMLFARGLEAQKMILEGATPAQVDRVLFEFGFPMGPFAMSDLAGLDIGWKEETSTSSTVRELLCESGRRGQKNGRGYYTYDPETRASTPDPEVEAMIREFAEREGISQRELGDSEVLERCLYPMVNEGAKILEEGIALRGSDVDVVWVNGYGWPVYRGGPMFWADSVGLSDIVSSIEGYGDSVGGDHWDVSPLLKRLADAGQDLHSHSN